MNSKYIFTSSKASEAKFRAASIKKHFLKKSVNRQLPLVLTWALKHAAALIKFKSVHLQQNWDFIKIYKILRKCCKEMESY